MFFLTNKVISNNITKLLCSYQNNYKCKNIFYQDEPCLQTFTVAEKIVFDRFCFDEIVYKDLQKKYMDKELLYFRDIDTESWIKGMICDQLDKILGYTDEEKKEIIDYAYINTLLVLKYKIGERYICEDIYNQEFIDVLRNITAYTLFGDFDHVIDSANMFNNLADKIIPPILEKIDHENHSLKFIFKMSIASGMSGLDLKGAPAASSNYANSGISMKNYFNMELEEVLDSYYISLLNICKTSTTPCFDWDILELKIRTCKRLLWFTDDYIESYFDLYFIQKIMEKYSIIIEIVPKNGIFGNDMSWMRLIEIIDNFSIFKKLRTYMSEGRLLVNENGPKMAAINLQKLSNELVDSIESSDFCILKGCRIHEMIQGNLNIESFSAYIVSRELSEIITGFNSHEYPILLIYLKPGEYAYWGINGLNEEMELSDGRKISTIYSPLISHINRKNLCDVTEIILEFETIKEKLKYEKGNQRKILQEMDLLGERLIESNRKIYNMVAKQYSEKRNDVSSLDKQQWDKIKKFVPIEINDPPQLLDAGAGNGRDLLYAKKLGYRVFGIDYSEEFYQILLRLEEETKLEKKSCQFGDLRNLPWEENTFDIVRQNATLLHFPVIGIGYGADKVVAESFRVLKPGGILFISVKKGNGLVSIDTGEGLGIRCFQLYSSEVLTLLIERNGFTILSLEDVDEVRNDSVIKWIVIIARKGDKSC